jgi:hypothetical protein
MLKDVASYRATEGSGYLGATFPYMAVPSGDVGPTSFFITSGETTEIREYSFSGTLRRLIRLDEPAQPVTRSEYDRLAAVMAGESERLQKAYAAAPLPTNHPAFVELIVDQTGQLWARIYSALNSDPSWLVFDVNGRCLGAVTLPSGLEVQHIGSDFVLGRWRGADDVEYVRMHRLRR